MDYIDAIELAKQALFRAALQLDEAAGNDTRDIYAIRKRELAARFDEARTILSGAISISSSNSISDK